MKILINTASTLKGGGIQVAKSFIEECKNFSENKYIVILSPQLKKMININEFTENFTFFDAPFRPATRVFKLKSHNFFLKDIEKNYNPDVVFTTSGPSYWKSTAPHLMGYNIPHYIYPESPYFNIISFEKKLWWYGMKIFARYMFKRDADALVVQTNDVNERARRLFNKSKVFTVYNTINSHYLIPKKVIKKLPKKNEKEFRFLTLSAWYPHKNLSIIPKIIKELEQLNLDIKFVVTLPDIDFKRLNIDTFSNRIINVGPVRVDEAPSLYEECDGMFLPTLLECFSASYVEAMRMKKPILTSDLGFAHTICENAAIYFNPMDEKDIVKKIEQVVNSDNLKNELVENGLKQLKSFGTATARAKQYLEICQSLINEK